MKKYNILFKIAFRLNNEEWITDSGGIWKKSFNNDYPEIDSEITENMESADWKDIISVSVNGYDHTRVTSYTDTIDGRASALAAEPSFIFDNTTDTIYIRFEDYEDPRVLDVFIGIAMHISTLPYDDTENNILYRDDIVSIPVLKESKDLLFFSKITFESFNVDINNAGMKYNSLISKNITGQVGQYWRGAVGAPFSEYEMIYQAKVEKLKFADRKLSLRLTDQRKILSRKLPFNYYSEEDYPDMRIEYVGKPKALLYGLQFNHVCIPLDDDAVQTNYSFMICDPSFHGIYDFGGIFDPIIYVGSTDVTSYLVDWSASGCTFKIPAAYYTPGQTVLFGGFGYVDDTYFLPIQNPLRVMIDLFENGLGILYNSNSFNEEEIDYEIPISENIALSLIEKKQFIDIIADLSSGTGIGIFLERDGRYTARSYDPDALPVLTIDQTQWEGLPTYEKDKSNLFSSVSVNYFYDLLNGTSRNYVNNNYEDEVYSAFGIYNEQPFDCLYTVKSSVEAFSESIMSRTKAETEIITGTIKDKYFDYGYAKIGKIAQIEVNNYLGKNQYSEWIGKVKCEIMEIEQNLENREVQIVFRIVKRIEEFEYEYEYDFNGDETTDILDLNGGDDTDILDLGGIE